MLPAKYHVILRAKGEDNLLWEKVGFSGIHPSEGQRVMANDQWHVVERVSWAQNQDNDQIVIDVECIPAPEPEPVA